MPTDLWWRNPKNYIRELIETGEKDLAWDRGVIAKFSLDPHKYSELHFPGQDWRALCIGGQGTMELGPDNPETRPLAVYPTWCYGDPASMLEELLENNVGDNESACFDLRVPVDERPVWGQKHMVVIAEGPPGGAATGQGRMFYRYLKELQDDNPHCAIYLHNSYSFRIMFGLGLRAADVDPRTTASKGKITTPSGETVEFEKAIKNPKWLAAVGMAVEDIKVPRNRCIFNIKSARWAADYYGELYNFKVKRDGGFADVTTPQVAYRPSETKLPITPARKAKAVVGDFITCDTCSLKDTCKYEREGAVCSVPDSDGASLANYFKTRDSSLIMDGLAKIMEINAGRIDQGLAEEAVVGLSPDVTKMLNQMFAHGVQLAKLVDPNLRGGTKVAVNVGVGQGGQAAIGITQGNSKQFVAGVVRELEAQGIPRDQITPSMIQGVMDGMTNPDAKTRSIEGTIISGETA